MKDSSNMLDILTGTAGSGNPYAGGVQRVLRMQRKRNKYGVKQCGCGRRISANKKQCLKCATGGSDGGTD